MGFKYKKVEDKNIKNKIPYFLFSHLSFFLKKPSYRRNLKSYHNKIIIYKKYNK